ncbi:MAG TPA: hypothetical protein EYN06_00030 [Myxococcales bacterium]|nr:hypothetical protein [Myxococcales bacterium]HIN84835.1 hypothetical protein [Myxococcales bacterium]
MKDGEQRSWRRIMSKVVLFLTICAVVWSFQTPFGTTSHHIRFNLVNLEVPDDAGALTYKSIKKLSCVVANEDAEAVATIQHFGASAIAKVSSLNLPEGNYQLRCDIAFSKEGGKIRVVPRLIDVFLGGGEISVHL